VSCAPALSREQAARYARQLLLPEVGRAGQERLLAARVLVRAGAASTAARAAATYLAAAGVGTICLAGEPPAGAFGWGADDLRALNADVCVVAAPDHVDEGAYDAVVDLSPALGAAAAAAAAAGPDAALAGALAAVEALKRLLAIGRPAPAA
jgi:hypothetical protein